MEVDLSETLFWDQQLQGRGITFWNWTAMLSHSVENYIHDLNYYYQKKTFHTTTKLPIKWLVCLLRREIKTFWNLI